MYTSLHFALVEEVLGTVAWGRVFVFQIFARAATIDVFCSAAIGFPAECLQLHPTAGFPQTAAQTDGCTPLADFGDTPTAGAGPAIIEWRRMRRLLLPRRQPSIQLLVSEVTQAGVARRPLFQ